MAVELMKINDDMKNSLWLAMEDRSLNFLETVEQGIMLYVDSFGIPTEAEDEEVFIKFFHECHKFVVDETIMSLILKGVVEIKSIDDGEPVYGLAINTNKE